MIRGRFDVLRDHLFTVEGDELVMTFEEVEAILRAPLPSNAHLRGWWDHTQKNANAAGAWRAAGFNACLLPDRTSVRFTRIWR